MRNTVLPLNADGRIATLLPDQEAVVGRDRRVDAPLRECDSDGPVPQSDSCDYNSVVPSGFRLIASITRITRRQSSMEGLASRFSVIALQNSRTSPANP